MLTSDPRLTPVESAIAAIQAIQGHENFLKRLSDSEVLATAVEAASVPLVYLIPARAGGIGLVVWPDGSVTFLDLPAVSQSALEAVIGAYLDGYNAFRLTGRLQAFESSLETAMTWLWGAIAEKLVNEFGRRQDDNRMVLIATGALALLPVHAASSGDRGSYALDHLCIAYAPSSLSLVRARHQAASAPVGTFLAVDDPWPVSAPSLSEELMISYVSEADFPACDRLELTHHRATRRAVMREMSKHSVIHLRCHGSVDPEDPLETSLLLAYDERLTLRDLLENRLDGVRLAVLSACESALPGTRTLEEAISLPTAFLQAGAAATIASLWPVDDVATTLLLTRFYTLWRQQLDSPAEALRQAQRWLRDLTREERAAAFPNLRFRDVGAPSSRPYARPYWWAGFQFTGA